MPLPDWLKQQDDGDELQPRAAAPAPQAQPQDPQPEADAAEDAAPDEAPEPPAPESPAPQPEPSEPEPPEDQPPPTGNDQVLSMLAGIEQHLRQLGDVQRQHEDQLALLIDRAGPATDAGADPEGAEPQGKQPSFVVEMDEDGQAPPDNADRRNLESMASELEASRRQTDQMRQQLETAQAHIAEFSEQPVGDGGNQGELAEELEAAQRKIEALQTRVIELEAVASVGDDDADADEKDEQIAALTEQVAQLEEALRQSGSQPEAAAPPDGASAEMIERQRKQIERLTEQLATVNAGADPDAISARDARIAELEEELEELQGQRGGKEGVGKLVAGFGGALRQVRGKKGSGDGQEASALEERVAELEVECKRLREEAERATTEADQARELLQQQAADGGGSGDEAQEILALRARVAELERSPGAGSGELRAKVEAEYREKWGELNRRQNSMAATEEKMRRRWARPQAVVVFGWLVGLAVVVGIVSWLLAGRMFPATIAASVNVEAKSKTGAPVSEEDRANWQAVHTALLRDDAFRKFVAKRLADQRLDDYGDHEVLAERLDDDLTVDSPKAGAITLTLAGKDPDQTQVLLDAVASSLAMWSSQQAGKRGDGAVALVRGERREAGQVRYATINPTPIRDRRWLSSLIVFAVGFVVSYFLITRIYQGLLRAKSEMEEEDPVLADPGF
jgi:uncharacterized membrane protein (DUF485 family)